MRPSVFMTRGDYEAGQFEASHQRTFDENQVRLLAKLGLLPFLAQYCRSAPSARRRISEKRY